MDSQTTTADILMAVGVSVIAAILWLVWRYFYKLFNQTANLWATRDLDAPVSPFLARGSKFVRALWLVFTIFFTVVALLTVAAVILNTVRHGFK